MKNAPPKGVEVVKKALAAKSREIRIKEGLTHAEVLKQTGIQPGRFESGNTEIFLTKFLTLLHCYGYTLVIRPMDR